MSIEEENDNNIWTIGLANVACAIEIFDFKEIVYICVNNFPSRTRTIMLEMKKIPMNPKAFRWIFTLPESNKRLKLSDEDNFLKSEASWVNII